MPDLTNRAVSSAEVARTQSLGRALKERLPSRFDRRTYRVETLLVDLLAYRAKTQGDQLAYRYLPRGEEESDSFTYAELHEQALQVAACLRDRVAPGERALLLYPPGLGFISAFFGCLLASVIPVPLPLPRRGEPSGRLQHVNRDAQPSVALTLACTHDLVLRALGESVRLPILWSDCPELSRARPEPQEASARDDIAFIQYTSGSTGAPKGVLVTHSNLVSNLFQIEEAFGHTSASRAVLWLPHYHDMGLIGGILQPFFVGFEATFLPPIALVQRPLRWLEAVSRYRATTSGGPNFGYQLCNDRIAKLPPELDLSSWEVAFCGAEAVRPATLRAFAQKLAPHGFKASAFLPCYGLAEATLLVTAAAKGAGANIKPLRVDQLGAAQQLTRPADRQDLNLVSSGFPRADTRITILDRDTQTPCPDGVIGEIVVQGRTVSPGYWRTERAGKPSGAERAEPLRTGDLGFMHEGELFVTGRCKDLIIIRGANIAPDDIEESARRVHPLLQHEASAAFAVEAQEQGECLVLIQEVSTRSMAQLDFPQLGALISQAVAREYGVAAAEIVFVRAGSIDRTTSGKVSRSACKASFINKSLQRVDS